MVISNSTFLSAKIRKTGQEEERFEGKDCSVILDKLQI